MMAVGAALGIAPFKSELPGRLVVFGSPAEEGGGGKVIMSQAGLFRDIDAALIVHPACYTLVEVSGLAIAKRSVVFHGKPAHAASHPDRGVNALDAIIQTFNGISALRQHIRDGARIHGVVTDGGLKPNIVPERSAAQVFVRAEQNDYRDELVDKVHRCAEGAALASGAELEWSTVAFDCNAVLPNHVLSEVFTRHLTVLGVPIDAANAGLGSTDMGNVSWEVPAIHPFIRIVPGAVAGHSREFAAAAGSEDARPALLSGAKAMAATAIDLWQDSALMRRARDEFELATRPRG
jgi:amidohydrolase